MTQTRAPASESLASQLAGIADEFRDRARRGENPDVEAYAAQFPKLADVLRQVLPAMQVLSALSGLGEPGAPPTGGFAEPLGELGDFRILREVGRGGMGIVYEAEQVSLGRRVALKVLPFAATMDPKHLQRFHNEAKAAASLKHEHIVHVYGVGCERGVHYFAMEFIEGQTLAEVIAEIKQEQLNHRATENTEKKLITAPLSSLCSLCLCGNKSSFFRGAAGLIADAADALEHAHTLGIVHRDVKPGNLLLDVAGKVYVSDFGLARYGPDAGLTMTGDVLGTLRYMAPEQALAKHGLVDHRADVYGLGATLYELLTGRPAVGGTDKADIVRRIAFEEPLAPRKLDKAIPAELETITLKCLAKNPNERYATGGELAADLRRFVEDKPIQAKPPTAAQRIRKWSRRHKPLVWSAVTAAVALLAATAIVLWVSNRLITAERDQKASALIDRDEALAVAQTNYEKAERERLRAEKYFLKARLAVNRLLEAVS